MFLVCISPMWILMTFVQLGLMCAYCGLNDTFYPLYSLMIPTITLMISSITNDTNAQSTPRCLECWEMEDLKRHASTESSVFAIFVERCARRFG